MDERTNKNRTETEDDRTQPALGDDEEVVGGEGEPVGDDNIRDGTVRGTMHGGPTASQGEGQGG